MNSASVIWPRSSLNSGGSPSRDGGERHRLRSASSGMPISSCARLNASDQRQRDDAAEVADDGLDHARADHVVAADARAALDVPAEERDVEPQRAELERRAGQHLAGAAVAGSRRPCRPTARARRGSGGRASSVVVERRDLVDGAGALGRRAGAPGRLVGVVLRLGRPDRGQPTPVPSSNHAPTRASARSCPSPGCPTSARAGPSPSTGARAGDVPRTRQSCS